jgi:hypothetical protein
VARVGGGGINENTPYASAHDFVRAAITDELADDENDSYVRWNEHEYALDIDLLVLDGISTYDGE